MSKISIVIPSYRSAAALENNLPYLMNYLKASGKDFEVLIVDDGSQDDGATQRVAEQNHCKYLSYPENQGKGNAVRFGMKQATGDILIFTDADIPFEPEAIDAIIHYIEFKEFHLVIGDRGLEESKRY